MSEFGCGRLPGARPDDDLGRGVVVDASTLPPPADLLGRLHAQPGGSELLAAATPGAFLVGGAVRDLLLGRHPRELDVVVEGEAAAVRPLCGTARRCARRQLWRSC